MEPERNPPWRLSCERRRLSCPDHPAMRRLWPAKQGMTTDGRGGGPLSPVSPHSGDDPRPATKAGDAMLSLHASCWNSTGGCASEVPLGGCTDAAWLPVTSARVG